MKNDTCKYYRPSYTNTSCMAGVNYRTAYGDGRGLMDRLPCMTQNDSRCETPCAKREFPTAEELAEHVRKLDERKRFTDQAIVLCAQDAQANGFKVGVQGSVGVVECPKCHGRLKYTVARSNGHIWGQCQTTKGCLNWMQ